MIINITNITIGTVLLVSSFVVIDSLWQYYNTIDKVLLVKDLSLCTVNFIAGLHSLVMAFNPSNEMLKLFASNSYIIIDLLLIIVTYITYLAIRRHGRHTNY